MDKVIRKAMIGTAAVVAAKYLDAKIDLLHDFQLITAVVGTKIKLPSRNSR